MSIEIIGIIGIIILFVLIFIQVPIGFAMALVGFLGVSAVRGMGSGLSVVGTEFFGVTTQYAFSVIPFFVGMGFFASEFELSADLFIPISKWIGHVRGGLTMASAVCCAIFAAISGDAISTATTMSSAGLPEMRKRKYKDFLSLGTFAAGGNLGFLIPPSLAFILYAVLTQQSVGTLFIAGIFPGILLTILFIITIWLICKFDALAGPPSEPVSWSERFASLGKIWGSVLLIVIVLGGIYFGVFTATEAGAVGFFGALVLGIVMKRVTWQRLTNALGETGRLVGQVFLLVIGATILSRFVTVTEIPLTLSKAMLGLGFSSYGILWFVLIFYLFIGCLMDIGSIMLICAPIFHPILVNAGFDPLYCGVLTVMIVLVGHITPPIGIVAFALKAAVPEVPMLTIFKGAIPFIGAMVICIIILVYIPQISLVLPYLMKPS